MLNTIARTIRSNDLAIFALLMVILCAIPMLSIVGAVAVSGGSIPFVVGTCFVALITTVVACNKFIDWTL